MTNGLHTLDLDGPLTIRTITTIKQKIADSLVEARADDADLQIAINSDAEIDLTLPQLLLAAQSQAARLGTNFTLKNPISGNFYQFWRGVALSQKLVPKTQFGSRETYDDREYPDR